MYNPFGFAFPFSQQQQISDDTKPPAPSDMSQPAPTSTPGVVPGIMSCMSVPGMPMMQGMACMPGTSGLPGMPIAGVPDMSQLGAFYPNFGFPQVGLPATNSVVQQPPPRPTAPSTVPPGPQQQPAKSLWIGNLHPETTEEEIRAVFEKFGTIDNVKVTITAIMS